jgi:hypothetical protein
MAKIWQRQGVFKNGVERSLRRRRFWAPNLVAEAQVKIANTAGHAGKHVALTGT